MSKPTLTREQSDSLTAALKRHEPAEIIRLHAIDPKGWLDYTPMGALNTVGTMTLAAAFINGWGVKKSPIEALRVYRKLKVPQKIVVP